MREIEEALSHSVGNILKVEIFWKLATELAVYDLDSLTLQQQSSVELIVEDFAPAALRCLGLKSSSNLTIVRAFAACVAASGEQELAF